MFYYSYYYYYYYYYYFIIQWVLNKAGVKREQLDTVKARKLAYYGHTMRKQWNCLEKEIMQGTMPGARRRESTSMVWPTLGSRTAKEQNRTSPWVL